MADARPTPVIILDVDHTLLHSVNKKVGKPVDDRMYLQTSDYYVHLRPHLMEFMEGCFQITPYVILWSAGSEGYLDEAIDLLTNMFTFHTVISRDTYGTVKKNVDLLMTNPLMETATIIFIDDIVSRINTTSDNVIVYEIKKYYASDDEDKALISTLTDLKMIFGISDTKLEGGEPTEVKPSLE